jgi:hypothetical protein
VITVLAGLAIHGSSIPLALKLAAHVSPGVLQARSHRHADRVLTSSSNATLPLRCAYPSSISACRAKSRLRADRQRNRQNSRRSTKGDGAFLRSWLASIYLAQRLMIVYLPLRQRGDRQMLSGSTPFVVVP